MLLVCHSGKAATGASLGLGSPNAASRLSLCKPAHEVADYSSPGEEGVGPDHD